MKRLGTRDEQLLTNLTHTSAMGVDNSRKAEMSSMIMLFMIEKMLRRQKADEYS